MRLDKFIAYALNLTRKEATSLIKSGRIKIDGKVIKSGDTKVLGKVYLDDQEIIYKEYRYFMLNKPKGYLSTTSGEKSVLELVSGVKDLKVCGRLDIDTTGLIILTNDGDFIHKVTSPKSDIYKTYYVEVDGEFINSHVESFKNGFDLIDTDKEIYHTKEAKLEILSTSSANISICEGRFHQIKKMCHEVGCVVTNLKRIKIGSLTLDESLKEGEYKELTKEELDKIFVK